jgi:aspartate-semialdehyde dehydrogenase
MVGSVLMERMKDENDFTDFIPLFFSTSQAGQSGPDIGIDTPLVEDAYNIDRLSSMDVIISCQGGNYTEKCHPELRRAGWDGYWIDAASTLRMKNHSVIILDPVNRGVIDQALKGGIKDYIGGNCTVSLMLMALGGLFDRNLIEWMTSMTYQAASGAGAKNMRELVLQMQAIGDQACDLLADPASTMAQLDRNVTATIRSNEYPTDHFGAALAGCLIPWIDRAWENGQTKEEWKGGVETNKILGRNDNDAVPIDGQCVRIGAMRCHSQAFTVKMRKNVPLDEIEDIIAEHNQWVHVVPNEKEATLAGLTPAKVSGFLEIPVGRIRKLNMGPEFLTAFTVGDQLLWGAAEPLRRMLQILKKQR